MVGVLTYGVAWIGCFSWCSSTSCSTTTTPTTTTTTTTTFLAVVLLLLLLWLLLFFSPQRVVGAPFLPLEFFFKARWPRSVGNSHGYILVLCGHLIWTTTWCFL